jgi:hypothetical protein
MYKYDGNKFSSTLEFIKHYLAQTVTTKDGNTNFSHDPQREVSNAGHLFKLKKVMSKFMRDRQTVLHFKRPMTHNC